MVAQKAGIKKHIIAGDLFDFDFAKWQKIMDGEAPGNLDNEITKTDPLMAMLNWFDEIYLISGNHETRLGRITDARIQARHVVHVYGKELGDKLQFSEYDKAYICDDDISRIGARPLIPKSENMILDE